MKRVALRIGIALGLLIVITGFVAAEGAQEGAAAEEPVVIRWHGSRGFPGEDLEIPGMLADLVSQKVGFPVEWDMVGTAEHGHHPQLQQLLAANEMPDCYLYMSLDEDFLSQAAAAIELEEIFEYMPNMTKAFRNLMEQSGLEEQETRDFYKYDDGMMKGVPRVWTGGWVPSGQMWRKDILDELGYDIPSTLAEAEEVFEAYKAVYPDKYATSGRGKTWWQCFDLVMNAYGIVSGGQHIRDGKVVQFFATREFREALQVLRRWYEKEYWDPDFINQGLEYMESYGEGDYIVWNWTKDWDFYTGEPTRYLEPLREIPGATAVAARHLAANEDTKPIQRVWNPFLGQVTGFGKHLENDREKLHKVMQVGDLFGTDMEVNFLAGNGIEGVHYELNEDGLPEPLPDYKGLTPQITAEKWGYGYFWTGTFSNFRPITSREQKKREEFVLNPGAIYSQESIDYWYPVIRGPVTDEAKEPVEAQTMSSPFELMVDIITGAQPIEYYDEWLDYYYDSGGRMWEEHATRLWGPE